MKRPVVWIVSALVLLEIVRRVSSAADCYVALTYSPFRVGAPHAESRNECARRHLAFPFYFDGYEIAVVNPI